MPDSLIWRKNLTRIRKVPCKQNPNFLYTENYTNVMLSYGYIFQNWDLYIKYLHGTWSLVDDHLYNVLLAISVLLYFHGPLSQMWSVIKYLMSSEDNFIFTLHHFSDHCLMELLIFFLQASRVIMRFELMSFPMYLLEMANKSTVPAKPFYSEHTDTHKPCDEEWWQINNL